MTVALVPSCDPVFDVEGAFFPAWMLCMVVGITLTFIARWVLARAGIEEFLGPLPLIYTCLALLLTLATWVVFFNV